MKVSFEDVKALCNEKGYKLTDSDIMYNVKALNVMDTFTHGKLTTRELFESLDFLSDLLQEKEPAYAAIVPADQRIRIQTRTMESIPQTAGKLTPEEKEALAFCVYHITCVRVYDEKQNVTVGGIVDFDSVDHVKMLYDETRERRPELFRENTIADYSDYDDYGFSEEHPIMLSSIRMSYEYLDSLRYDGKPVEYNRLGSGGSGGDILDIYAISAKKFLKKMEWVLYVDCYAETPVIKPPKGFTLQ